MFSAVFGRIMGRPAPAAPARAAPPAPTVPKRTESMLDAAGAALMPAGLGAQRPLVSASGVLAGFEFYAGAAYVNRLRPGVDVAAIRACTANVLGAMRLCSAQRLDALAGFPVSWLASLEGDGQYVPGLRLVLQADGQPMPAEALTALVQRLRKAGVLLGWQPGDFAPLGAPDFVQLRLPAGSDAAAWQGAAAGAASTFPGVPQVLLDLPSLDLMEAMLRPSVALAACFIGSNTTPARLQVLPPQAQRLLQLLNRLVRDDDTELLVKDIKSDAALALRLLQYLNSAGASPGRELDSIEQAVSVLGRDALYRFVSQMLVRLSPPRPAAGALQAVALARARLLELLARDAGEASPGTLYLLGLTSMLPTLLQCSLDDATSSLQLPAHAREALHGSGPWQAYLGLAQALERHDMVTTEALSRSFGGLDAVLSHSTRSWLAT